MSTSEIMKKIEATRERLEKAKSNQMRADLEHQLKRLERLLDASEDLKGFCECLPAHRDCFAYIDGLCTILTDAHFKSDCPFYKTNAKHLDDVENAAKANAKKGIIWR